MSAWIPEYSKSQTTRRQLTYFIEADGTPFVKIGRSFSAESRIESMQVGCPHTLRVLCVVTTAESTLHQLFADSRVNGEWFRRTRLMDQMIQHASRYGDLPPQKEWTSIFEEVSVVHLLRQREREIDKLKDQFSELSETLDSIRTDITGVIEFCDAVVKNHKEQCTA